MTWLPIANAPRDGTPVLLCDSKKKAYHRGRYVYDAGELSGGIPPYWLWETTNGEVPWDDEEDLTHFAFCELPGSETNTSKRKSHEPTD